MPKTTLRSVSLQITHFDYNIHCSALSFLAFAGRCMYTIKNTKQPSMSDVPGISPCFGRDFGSGQNCVSFPNEDIVLEISPGSLLLKETTGWGQRQFLLPGACSLASSFWIFLLSPLSAPPSFNHPPDGMLFLGVGSHLTRWSWGGVALWLPVLTCCPSGTLGRNLGCGLP